MGIEIDREHFDEADHARFRARLTDSVEVFERVLQRPDFGVGPAELGAELEVALTDERGRPLPLGEEVLRDTVDERMTLEIDRFNLECNLRHGPLAGRPFASLRGELESARAELCRAAALHGGRVEMIGILPTLREVDLGRSAMTSAIRYHALSRALRALRGGPFQLHIEGEDSLQLDCDDVTFEGAATSFQIHLRVAPEEFTDVFNAAQLATVPAIAFSGNSPTFLGHRLWDETRVALFKQSVDVRDRRKRDGRGPARVSLGSRWLEGGALDLFREAIGDHPVLLPVCDDEDPREALAEGRTPRLREIRLHQGTVWSWNRPVYDHHGAGHVRMELRALPAGPTITDMLANTAFLVGLSLGIAPVMKEVVEDFDFERAHGSFYRAARHGLAAEIDWPASLGGSTRPVPVASLVVALAEIARRGLRDAGVAPDEGDALVDCVVERVQAGQTGAVWQRRCWAEHLAAGCDNDEALRRMLADYSRRSGEGEPVHRWGQS